MMAFGVKTKMIGGEQKQHPSKTGAQALGQLSKILQCWMRHFTIRKEIYGLVMMESLVLQRQKHGRKLTKMKQTEDTQKTS